MIDELLAGLTGSAATGEFLERIDLPAALLTRRRKRGKLRFLHVNKAMSKMCGYAPGDLIGETPEMLQGEETDLSAARAFRAEIEDSGRGLANLVNYRRNGSAYEVLLVGTALESDEDETPESKLYACFSYFLGDLEVVPSRAADKTKRAKPN